MAKTRLNLRVEFLVHFVTKLTLRVEILYTEINIAYPILTPLHILTIE